MDLGVSSFDDIVSAAQSRIWNELYNIKFDHGSSVRGATNSVPDAQKLVTIRQCADSWLSASVKCIQSRFPTLVQLATHNSIGSEVSPAEWARSLMAGVLESIFRFHVDEEVWQKFVRPREARFPNLSACLADVPTDIALEGCAPGEKEAWRSRSAFHWFVRSALETHALLDTVPKLPGWLSTNSYAALVNELTVRFASRLDYVMKELLEEALINSALPPGTATFGTRYSDETALTPQVTMAWPEAKVEPQPSSLSVKEETGRFRVNMVLKAEAELKVIRPQMKADADYERLKASYPDYVTLRAAQRDPEIKELLLGVQGHHQRRAGRLAKQIAASECNVRLNTIEKAWEMYKPIERRTARYAKQSPPSVSLNPSASIH